MLLSKREETSQFKRREDQYYYCYLRVTFCFLIVFCTTDEVTFSNCFKYGCFPIFLRVYWLHPFADEVQKLCPRKKTSFSSGWPMLSTVKCHNTGRFRLSTESDSSFRMLFHSVSQTHILFRSASNGSQEKNKKKEDLNELFKLVATEEDEKKCTNSLSISNKEKLKQKQRESPRKSSLLRCSRHKKPGKKLFFSLFLLSRSRRTRAEVLCA